MFPLLTKLFLVKRDIPEGMFSLGSKRIFEVNHFLARIKAPYLIRWVSSYHTLISLSK